MLLENDFSVAIPWNLSHYIPFNTFNPLYKPLFAYLPDKITVNAWDTLKLLNQLESYIYKGNLLENFAQEKVRIAKNDSEIFAYKNRFLTEKLPGDIEFHHTVPVASLTRPFILHCESFSALGRNGSYDTTDYLSLKNYYISLFKSNKCIGIFSHLPETINLISSFFNSEEVDNKLIYSRIGISDINLDFRTISNDLDSPRFLFINKSNVKSSNFFWHGGHIVLRFWKEFLRHKPASKLILRTLKPSDNDLALHNVDMDFIKYENNRSILWVENHLSTDEQEMLIAQTNFFLSPGRELNSVATMQAMQFGTIPVVADILGIFNYIPSDLHGVVLKGVNDELSYVDPIITGSSWHSEKLDVSLVSQMLESILKILNNQVISKEIQENIISYATKNFSGVKFATDFWSKVSNSYNNIKKIKETKKHVLDEQLVKCLASKSDIINMFSKPTEPLKRIYTGMKSIYEMSDMVIETPGDMDINLIDWPILTKDNYLKEIKFLRSMHDLQGQHITSREIKVIETHKGRLVRILSSLLRPFPTLHQYVKNKKGMLTNLIKSLLNYFFGLYKQELSIIIENCFGYNIVHYYKYYAVPLKVQVIDIDKLIMEKHKFFSSFSLEKLLKKINKD